MPERLDMKAAVRRPATRRAFLAGLAGASAACSVAGVRAQTYVDPPVFRTMRAQYVILDPLMPLKPAILRDLNGRKTVIGLTKGKVRLVHVWASWCASCREDLIELQRFQSTADPRTEVITISTDKLDPHRVKAFLYGLGVDRLIVLHDPDGVVAGRNADAPLPLYSLPITYVVTSSGLVAGYIKGRADWSSPDARRLLAYYGS